MPTEPCVRVPFSEMKWILAVCGSIHVDLVDHLGASEDGLEGAAELERVQQDVSEMGYLIELLEARAREALTGEDTSPALSAVGGHDVYLGSRAPFNADDEWDWRINPR